LNLRRLAGNRPLLLIYAGFTVYTAIFYCVLYGLPQLLEEYGGYDTSVVGLLMLPLAAISLVVTPLAARGIERWGVRRMLVAGAIGLTASTALLLLLGVSLAIVLVVIVSALFGL